MWNVMFAQMLRNKFYLFFVIKKNENYADDNTLCISAGNTGELIRSFE